jgi:predicted TIM-barrel fold metal-dependent hydrolase
MDTIATGGGPLLTEGARGTLYGVGARQGTHTLMEDPVFAEPKYPLISVDDHVLETPEVFTSRVPKRLSDQVPHVIEESGVPLWHIGDLIQPIIASNALVGRPLEEWDPYEPLRYDEMRKGAWNVDARIPDMDVVGVRASMNFPSMIFGFAGQLFLNLSPEVGIASVDAWNDWIYEEWFLAHPNRIIPMQLVWLGDSTVAAAQVRRNAERGFHSVSFSEIPERLGLPSIHSGYWEPFIEACVETDTAINLHVGSSSNTITGSSDAPDGAAQMLFPVSAIVSATDWLTSGIPVRHPAIKIVLSEGGIGWVPMLLDRLDHLARFDRQQHITRDLWRNVADTPSEILLRNFYFTTFEDPTSFRIIDRIGVQNVMLEVDYPHQDSSWPRTQLLLDEQFTSVPTELIRGLVYDNAARVYNFASRDS